MSEPIMLPSGVMIRAVREDDAAALLDAAEQGRGPAGAAVAAVLGEAGRLGLHRIEAATSPSNVGSQKVLLRNGFQQYGTAHSHLFLNGAWQDSHLYELILGDRPPAV